MHVLGRWRWPVERKRAARARVAAIRVLPSASRPLAAALAAVTLLAGVVPIAFTVAAGIVVGSIPTVATDGFDAPSGRALTGALAVMGALYVFQQALGPLRNGVIAALSMRVDTQLADEVMEHLTDPSGVAHFEDPAAMDQVGVARGVVFGGLTPGAVVGPLSTITGNYLRAILATAILMRFNVWIALVLLAIHLMDRSRGRQDIFRLVQVQTGQAQAMRHSDYFRDLIMRPEAAKETRVFGLLGWIQGRFRKHWTTAMDEIWADRRGMIRPLLSKLVVVLVPLLLVFVALARAATTGSIGLTELSIYAMAVFDLRAISHLGIHDIHLEYGTAALPATRELPKVVGPSWLPNGTRDPDAIPLEGVAFENVSFTYPGTDREVLSNLDLDIRHGESLAIVGANGSGKTTLVKLLCRFYDPTAGRVTADGVDIRQFDVGAWQRRIGAIFQDFVRYELPARANVGFGALDRIGDDRVLDEAARRAGADAIVERLPLRWETTLSRRYEGGVDLSGGEWQRIALARAMAAAGGGIGILVLDEPTANLDVRGEAEIYARFLDITQELTSVVISHRFSTVRRADRICVLEDGRVAEHGSHEELMSRDGRYATMFRMQADRFAEQAADE